MLNLEILWWLNSKTVWVLMLFWLWMSKCESFIWLSFIRQFRCFGHLSQIWSCWSKKTNYEACFHSCLLGNLRGSVACLLWLCSLIWQAIMWPYMLLMFFMISWLFTRWVALLRLSSMQGVLSGWRTCRNTAIKAAWIGYYWTRHFVRQDCWSLSWSR